MSVHPDLRKGGGASYAHANNFDAIRIIAALAVLVSHHFALVGQFEPSILGLHTLGGAAVLVFFLISGYLVTASWLTDPDFMRFGLRRALRVLPALAAVVVATAYGLGSWTTSLSLNEYLSQKATHSYISNIWMVGQGWLPGVFENNPLPRAVNGSLWTIPIEVQCYAVLACAGAIGLLRIKTLWLLLVGIAILGYQFKFGADLHPEWKLKREMIMYFFTGSAIFRLTPHWSQRRNLWTAAILCATLSSWFLDFKYIAFWLLLSYFVIYFGTQATPFIRKAGHWGDPSYGIYLIAFPVQQTIIMRFFPTYGFTFTLALSVGITVTLAYISWHSLEKIALQFKPNKRPEP